MSKVYQQHHPERTVLYQVLFHYFEQFLLEYENLFFTREVFSLLLRKQLINSDPVKKILSWRHIRFNVHSKVRTESKDETERVGKYMIRPILSPLWNFC